MKNKFLAGLLAVLGFSVAGLGCYRDMYGSPYADFEVKGNVVDSSSGDPIEGIKVVVERDRHEGEFYKVMSTETNAAGGYTMREADGWWSTEGTLRVIAEDVDGEENGGSFAKKTVEVPFVRADFKGGGKNWYLGKAVKTVNFELEKVVPDNAEDDEE